MSSFIDEITKALGPDVTRQLTGSLGLKKNTAKQVLPMVTPLILSGLKRQMSERGGAPRVDHILNKYGSDSVLDNIAGLFGKKAEEKKPDPRLGGLLGDSGVQAAEFLSKNLNINGNTAMKIIPMVAPIILGFLTRKRDKGGAGIAGIASLIEQDGDGSILDDVTGFLTQGAGGKRRGGGLLGGLFDALTRR